MARSAVVVVEPDKSPVDLFRWGAMGPGYLPGLCSLRTAKGKVYCTKEFPKAEAVKRAGAK